MGRRIGIGCEFQGLFHISSPSSSTACTFMDTPLLIHSCLGHSNISKFRVIVPCFSSLSSMEYRSCQLGKHSRLISQAPRSTDKVFFRVCPH